MWRIFKTMSEQPALLAIILICIIGLGITFLMGNCEWKGKVDENYISEQRAKAWEEEKAEILTPSFPPDAEFVSEEEYEWEQRLKGAEERRVESTCYTLTGNMASGKKVYDGAVAMNNIPFGTEVYVVEHDKVYVVEDRIGWGSSFDVWMSDYKKCQAFGRRYLNIKILE